MTTEEKLTLVPAVLLLCRLAHTAAAQWLSHRTAMHRENAYNHRVEIAVRGTESEHREAIVRACTASPQRDDQDRRPPVRR
jgi:hypothetical protein